MGFRFLAFAFIACIYHVGDKMKTAVDSTDVPNEPIWEKPSLNKMETISNATVNSTTSKLIDYQYMAEHVENIRQQCGVLCDLPREENVSEGLFYESVKVDINCKALWNISFDEESIFTHAVQKLPRYIKRYFSYDNKIPINPFYFDDRVNQEYSNKSWGKIRYCQPSCFMLIQCKF